MFVSISSVDNTANFELSIKDNTLVNFLQNNPHCATIVCIYSLRKWENSIVFV